MFDVYREIMEEGEQRGALRMLAQILTSHFPLHARDLDELLGRCTMEDMEWLVQEALRVKTFPVLKKNLEARLSGR